MRAPLTSLTSALETVALADSSLLYSIGSGCRRDQGTLPAVSTVGQVVVRGSAATAVHATYAAPPPAARTVLHGRQRQRREYSSRLPENDDNGRPPPGERLSLYDHNVCVCLSLSTTTMVGLLPVRPRSPQHLFLLLSTTPRASPRNEVLRRRA